MIYYRDVNDRFYKFGLGGDVGFYFYYRVMINVININFRD